MKISTIRSLLILFDLALLGGVVGVVYHGMQQREERSQNRQEFQQDTYRKLKLINPERSEQTKRAPLVEVGKFNFDGRLPKEDEPDVPVTPVAPKNVFRPLGDLMAVVGAEMHGKGVETPSFILYTRTGDAPLTRNSQPTIPSRDRGGRPVPRPGGNRQPAGRRPPTPPPSSSPVRVVHRAYLGDAIEFSGHEIAVVRGVRPVIKEGQPVAWEAVFDYDSKEVTIAVIGDPAGPRPAAPAEPTGPIDPNPGTWIAWVPSKPHEINVTDMGVRAFKRDGEKVLDGVRWGTDRIGGKRVIKVTHIPKGGALEAGGVKPGDAFESINGTPVSSKADIVRYVKANPNLPKYSVTFWRDGRRITRTVSRPKSAGS